MCGIVGVVSKSQSGFIKQLDDSFYQMLYVDALRGDDATGIIAVENDSTFHIAKDSVQSEWFTAKFKFEQKQITASMWSRGKVIIGHNRKATVGKNDENSAHPFVVNDKFAMVHNGTLLRHEHLAKTSVDSEALAIHLEKAVGDTFKEKLEVQLADVFGAYALAMYDQTNHKVYLLRNKERPLSVVEVDNAWYFMSESLMGAWILSRNGYEYSKLKFHHLVEHQLATFDLDKNTMKLEMITPKKATSPSIIHTFGQTAGKVKKGTTQNIPTISANKGKPLKGGEKDLKRFRRDWLGKRISFWPDDYVEKNFPKTIDDDGETEVKIIGSHEEVEYWHCVNADVDLSKLGLKYAEDITTRKWSGVIEAISVTCTGLVHLDIIGCKPMANSILKLDVVHKLRNFKNDMEKKTTEQLNVIYEENKHIYETDKLNIINSELSFRNSIKSLEEAAIVAKEKGYILAQKQIENLFVYTDPTGRIYYESAITLH